MKKSSFIKSIKQKSITLSVVDVEITSGKKYRYYDVPMSVYNKFMAAESKGKFFTANIKDKYFFEQLN